MMSYIIVAVLYCALLPLLLVFDGYVLMRLWSWFVVPILHAPELPLPVAIGVGLIAAHLTHQTSMVRNEDDWKFPLQKLAESAVLKPGMLLLLGWGLKTYFMGP